MGIKEGDKIKVHYTGKLDDGQVFDSTEGKQPLEFEVGSGKIIKGFDDGVKGMEKGEEKEIQIKSEDAYGQPKPEMTQKIPKDKLPKEPEPKEGMMLMLSSQDGRQFPAKIKEIGDNEVTLDLNHPLAGKDLNFTVKVEEIESK